MGGIVSLPLFESPVQNPEGGSQQSDCHDRPGLISLNVVKQDRQGYAKDITTDSQQGGVNGSAEGVEKQEFAGFNLAGTEDDKADRPNSVKKAKSDDEQTIVHFQ